MKKLLVLLVVFISFNSFSNVVESSLNENKPRKGFNYKKMRKKNARCKRRNIFGCKNYTFNR